MILLSFYLSTYKAGGCRKKRGGDNFHLKMAGAPSR